ncbi:MAG: hypothetical protein LBL43_02130 [Treponema sp.]|nr:hypothetical protein [Treponema sp.]
MINKSLKDKDSSDSCRIGDHDPPRVSVLMLERYNLGELTRREKAFVEAALSGEPGLAERLREIRESDGDIRRRGLASPAMMPRVLRLFPRPLLWGAAAAARVLVISFPLSRGPVGLSGDRVKGGAGMVELRAYLKEEGVRPLQAGEAVLHAGDTIQLAYTVRDAGDCRYGVIFSIDGHAAVTLHYPYTPDSETRLHTGRQTFLEEAYTLDDAPDYELFFFVIGDEPLGVAEILNTARQLAGNPGTALERGPSIFKNYKLAVLRLRKE